MWSLIGTAQPPTHSGVVLSQRRTAEKHHAAVAKYLLQERLNAYKQAEREAQRLIRPIHHWAGMFTFDSLQTCAKQKLSATAKWLRLE